MKAQRPQVAKQVAKQVTSTQKVNEGKVAATKRRRGAQRPQPISRAKGT